MTEEPRQQRSKSGVRNSTQVSQVGSRNLNSDHYPLPPGTFSRKLDQTSKQCSVQAWYVGLLRGNLMC